MHWFVAAGAGLGALAGWRFVIRPAKHAYALAVALLRRIGDASGGVAILTGEVQALAGAIVQLATAIVDDQQQLRDEHRWLAERHGELLELVVDLDAAVHRIERHIGMRKGPTDEPN